MQDAFVADEASLFDRAWRLAMVVGFGVARLWWRMRKPQHQGALVAMHVGGRVLLLRSSYRRAWNFPGGGVHVGEQPDAAARREMVEEIGVDISALGSVALQPSRVECGVWDGRQERVHVFELWLDRLPLLRLDGREIVAARLVSPGEARGLRLTGPVAAYFAAIG